MQSNPVLAFCNAEYTVDASFARRPRVARSLGGILLAVWLALALLFEVFRSTAFRRRVSMEDHMANQPQNPQKGGGTQGQRQGGQRPGDMPNQGGQRPGEQFRRDEKDQSEKTPKR
jgi:hypothetical protein